MGRKYCSNQFMCLVTAPKKQQNSVPLMPAMAVAGTNINSNNTTVKGLLYQHIHKNFKQMLPLTQRNSSIKQNTTQTENTITMQKHLIYPSFTSPSCMNDIKPDLCCTFADKSSQFCTMSSELFNSAVCDQMAP